jgi:glycolate oxidase iron-sulfur subunit
VNPAAPADQFLDETKALACVHCGLCLSSCPTYLETGNENLSPRGRIYLMRGLQSGQLDLTPESVSPIDLCLGCRACEVACPSGVQYGALLEQTRDYIEHNHRRKPFQTFLRRFVIEEIFPIPWRMRIATAPAFLLKKLGLTKLLPTFLRKNLDLLPDQPSHGSLPAHSAATATRRATMSKRLPDRVAAERSSRIAANWNALAIARERTLKCLRRSTQT